MGFRSNTTYYDTTGEKVISRLSPEIAEKLERAGISTMSQNLWFAKRKSENGGEFGVEFEFKHNGMTVLYCSSDWLADQIHSRFRDQLYRAYGVNFSIIGTNGQRVQAHPENPKYGPSKSVEISAEEQIAVIQRGLDDLNTWASKHGNEIVNGEYISGARSLGKTMIETIKRKEAEKLARFLSAG